MFFSFCVPGIFRLMQWPLPSGELYENSGKCGADSRTILPRYRMIYTNSFAQTNGQVLPSFSRVALANYRETVLFPRKMPRSLASRCIIRVMQETDDSYNLYRFPM